jgi:hypothetical protein
MIPQYFTATFYVIDNDGIKVTQNNFKNFKTWTIKLLMRVTKLETIEVISVEVLGAKPYTGHVEFTTKAFNPGDYGTVLARHFNQLQENRAKLISVAVQAVAQSHKYKPVANVGHTWTLGENLPITETELDLINERVLSSSYTKLDASFYLTYSIRYRALVSAGDKTPIKSMKEIYYPDKSVKQVQAYATTCRRKGLLPPAQPGKNSKFPKPTKISKPTKKKGK